MGGAVADVAQCDDVLHVLELVIQVYVGFVVAAQRPVGGFEVLDVILRPSPAAGAPVSVPVEACLPHPVELLRSDVTLVFQVFLAPLLRPRLVGQYLRRRGVLLLRLHHVKT